MGNSLRSPYQWDAQMKKFKDDAVVETCGLKNHLQPQESWLIEPS